MAAVGNSLADKLSISIVRDPFDLSEVNKLYAHWLGLDANMEFAIGVNDFSLYSIFDPEGCFAGRIDEITVTILHALVYSRDYAFIGSFVTEAHLRRKGLGGKIWKAGLAHCKARIIGLYAALPMVNYYRRFGFVSYGKTYGYKIENLDRFDEPDHESVYEINSVSFEKLDTFDQKYVPRRRSEFLRAWITQPGSVGLVYVDHGRIRGYGVVRRCCSDKICRLGPLFADSPECAEKLLEGLLSRMSHAAHVLFETISTNLFSGSFAEKFGATLLEEMDIM